MRYIVGIDPGNNASAYCVIDEDMRPLSFAKQGNELMYCTLVEFLGTLPESSTIEVVIEGIASYGMPVGAEVFNTCIWIGKLMERFERADFPVSMLYRKDEKMAICHSPKANDATIRQALIDRFAYSVPNKGKGTKKNQGWFYGFRADIWQAYAIAVTYHDLN